MEPRTDTVDRIESLIAPTVVEMGFAIVRVLISGTNRPRLQVMAERSDGRAMTIDHCAEISRAISSLLDLEDPIAGAYTLEVSSPGLDRPLVRLADFERFAGREAKVTTRFLLDGRRRFRGRLLGALGETVRIEVEGRPVDLPFGEITKAKLILTDELLAPRREGQER